MALPDLRRYRMGLGEEGRYEALYSANIALRMALTELFRVRRSLISSGRYSTRLSEASESTLKVLNSLREGMGLDELDEYKAIVLEEVTYSSK